MPMRTPSLVSVLASVISDPKHNQLCGTSPGIGGILPFCVDPAMRVKPIAFLTFYEFAFSSEAWYIYE